MTRVNPLRDGCQSCLRSLTPGNMPNKRLPAVLRQNFCLPKREARYPLLSNIRITTRERGHDFQGWAIFSDGVLAMLMVKL